MRYEGYPRVTDRSIVRDEYGCINTEDTHDRRVYVVLGGCNRRGVGRILSRLRLQIKNGNGVRKDIDIVCGVRDAAAVNVNNTASTDRVEVIDADIPCLAPFDTQDPLLAVFLVWERTCC